MSKDKIADYDGSTAGNNTDIGGISIAEGMLPSAVNNSMRELTKQLGAFANGTDAIDGLSVDGTIKLDGNYPTGTNNVALGDAALGGGSLSGGSNVAIGTSALDANTSGTTNIAIGVNALGENTTASDNVAVGHSALKLNTTGARNTAVGYESLDANTTGTRHVAVGYLSLSANSTGNYNTAVGDIALLSNSTGSSNTAVGLGALEANTTGSENVAVGLQSLDANTTGANNVAVGRNALSGNTTAAGNVAVGDSCMFLNTTGTNNVAMGYNALVSNSSGSSNVAIGSHAGYATTTTGDGTFVGVGAGQNATSADHNTYIGRYAGGDMTSGTKNTIIGRYAGNQGGLDIRTASNNVVLSDGDGNPRVYIDNAGTNYVWSTAAPMIWGRNNTSGSVTGLAYCNTASHIGSFTGQVFRVMCDGDVENANNSYGSLSDIKLKENIVNAKSQWDDLKALQVRNYNFKAETGYSSHTQIGLIAQEVELISPNLVGQSIDDETNETTKTVNYSVLYMKAVKALQEAMTRIETLEAKVSTLEGE
jgi:hypothetical protein